MESEAELACFLGHEIAHVAFRHGMKEMEERKEMIFAGNALDEMSQAAGETDDIKEVSSELDDFALESYDTIFQGRLGEYEEEADQCGLLYAVRSGYDPKAMVNFLTRLGDKQSRMESEHYSPSRNKLRIARITKHLATKNWEKLDFATHAGRFEKMR